jgi:hypothetical protein
MVACLHFVTIVLSPSDFICSGFRQKRWSSLPALSGKSVMGSFDFEHCGCKQHYACFACRKAFKASLEFVSTASGKHKRRVVTCPECKQPMIPMGLLFRAPPQQAVKAWSRLEELARHSRDPLFQFPRQRRPKGACPGCGTSQGRMDGGCAVCGYNRRCASGGRPSSWAYRAGKRKRD